MTVVHGLAACAIVHDDPYSAGDELARTKGESGDGLPRYRFHSFGWHVTTFAMHDSASICIHV